MTDITKPRIGEAQKTSSRKTQSPHRHMIFKMQISNSKTKSGIKPEAGGALSTEEHG